MPCLVPVPLGGQYDSLRAVSSADPQLRAAARDTVATRRPLNSDHLEPGDVETVHPAPLFPEVR
ncbi:MAG: hypothetical protein AAFR57_17055, partial [Pseudomonadota bacterium]